MSSIKPKRDLLAHPVQDELVVYDMGEKKAHLLNQTAKRVWNELDGERSAEEIAGALELDQSVVELALDDLANAQLLDSGEPLPVSRRSALRTAAAAAAFGLLLPAVTTIPAPLAGQALSGEADIKVKVKGKGKGKG